MKITDEQVEAAMDWLNKYATEAAQARADRIAVEEFRKTVKSEIMRENADKPIGVQEAIAYADDRYKTHLEVIREAVKRDEWFRYMREIKSGLIEIWRTSSANERGARL